MDNDFLALIEEYKNDRNTIEKIRIYVLNHIYSTPNINEYIKLFLDTATLLKDNVGCALANGMFFWVYHGTNLKLAHEYNYKALKLYHTIPDYSKKIGYLSILNNEFIVNNYTGRLYDSYIVMKEAMALTSNRQNINYYFVYSINAIYLLFDLGLYNKVNEILNKINSDNIYLSNSDKAILLSLSAKINWRLNNNNECLSKILELQEFNNKNKVFDDYLIASYLLESYVKLDDKDNSKKYADILIKEISAEITDSIDLVEAYFALARFYNYIKDYDNAYKYYLKIFENYNNLLGAKLIFLDEAIVIFKKYNINKYYEAIEAKSDLLIEINKTLKAIANENKQIYDDFSEFRYKYLFEKMKKLTGFIQEINKTSAFEDIKNIVVKDLKDILEAKFVDLILATDDCNYKGIILEKNSDLMIFNKNELSSELSDCDEVLAFRMSGINLHYNFYVVVGYGALGNVEKKEIRYMLSLVKEVVAPIFLHMEKYNEAMINYNHDELTKIYNRYGLNCILDKQFKENKNAYLLMIDIDNFKNINDTYGHECGDLVLINIAKALDDFLGDKNVARIGGEEFIGFIADLDDVRDKLDNLLNKIRNMNINFNHLRINITISIGVALMNSKDEFKKAKIEADKKLYLAKNNGKNQYIM
mgnify:FL=1